MKDNDLIIIGKIFSPYGLKGECKVYPLTDFPDRFSLLEKVFLFSSDDKFLGEFNISYVKYYNKFILIKFDNIDNRTIIEKYKNSFIKIPREKLVPLEDGTYYVFDLIGLPVYEEDNYIGKVKDVIKAGNDCLEIVTLQGKEVLIPFVNEFVPVVDLENKIIKVKLIEGLLDL